MNILITGGAGYVGSVLTSHLLQYGHYVRVMDNLTYGGNSLVPFFDYPAFEFCHGDVRNLDNCEKAVRDMDCVIHLAAIVGEPACKNNQHALHVNILGTQNVYMKAMEAGTKFVFASTCSNYGQESLATEESKLNPLGEYAKQKVAAETWLQAQGNATILRFATAYGFSYRMRLDLMVQQFVIEALTKGKLELYNPDAWRPFVHVRDIARAIEFVIVNDTNGIFNVGGKNVTKRQLAQEIALYVPVDITTVETGDGRDYCVSFEKIKNRFGYHPVYSLSDFIPKMVEAQQKGIFSATRYKNTAH